VVSGRYCQLYLLRLLPLSQAQKATKFREHLFSEMCCCGLVTMATAVINVKMTNPLFPTYLLYLLYLLTPQSRVVLEKLTGSQLVKKFPAFYGTRKFITAFTSARQLSLSWASSIQSIPQHNLLKIHFNNISHNQALLLLFYALYAAHMLHFWFYLF
jgi:hypothetical protein